MSGALLREAAEMMRERAEGAVPGPWTVDRFFWKVGSTRGMTDGFWQEVTNGGDTICQIQEGDAADGPDSDLVHIASWHPAVALAVADWLDATAARHDEILSNFATGSRAGSVTASENVTAYTQALTVAAAYLGRVPSPEDRP